MQTITLKKEGSLESLATFTAPIGSFSVSFQKKGAGIWRAGEIVVPTFKGLNESLETVGVRLRYTGGAGRGERRMVAETLSEKGDAIFAAPVAEPEAELEAEPVVEPEAEPVVEPELEAEPEAEAVVEPVAKKKRSRSKKAASEPVAKKKGGRRKAA